MSTESMTPAEWGVILLDGIAFPVLQDVGYSNLALFPRKVTLGDYSKDSDDLQSSWILADFSGGGQIDTYNEGSDQGRFWFSTLHTRDPFQLTLNREVLSFAIDPAATVSTPGTDLSGTFYATFDAGIYEWDEATLAFGVSPVDSLDVAPVNLPYAFGEGAPGAGSDVVLWFPLGSGGYQTFDGAAAAAADTSITPVAFAEWDDELFALSEDGLLSSWDGATWTQRGRLDGRHTPIHLVSYFNRSDEPALHAITNKGVFAWDPISEKFYLTPLRYPAHPDNGLGVDVWQGSGDLFTSAGVGVYRYAIGSTISAVGLDRDHGLPAQYRGSIKDLRAEHNALYALVRGAEVATEDEPSAVLGEMMFWELGGQWLGAASVAVASLQYFTNIGWHCAWTSDQEEDVAGEPTRVQVSEADGAYRLWWGYGGNLYTMALPTDFHNPREGISAGVDRFQGEGYLETGWFDGAMLGFLKLASDVVLNIPTCPEGTSVTISYRIDNEAGWTELNTFTEPGRRVSLFGVDEDGFSVGVAFNRIRFRLDFASDDATLSALMDSLVFHFVKVPKLSDSYQLTVPVLGEDGWGGRSQREIYSQLDALLSQQTFIRLTHNERDYRVRVSQVQGHNRTGGDLAGVRGISIVEIRAPEDAPLAVAS